MTGARLTSTDQKLDMALDDLVEKKSSSAGRWDEDRRSEHGYGPDMQRHHQADAPYALKDSKGRGKGPRRPPEEKALNNTHCFFNSGGSLVVRLYETEVFVMSKRTEPGSAAECEVLTLTSGTFRTPETKYILNEALHLLGLRVVDCQGSHSKWTLSWEVKPPGKVDEPSSQPFEDGMEVRLDAPLVKSDAVKQHIVDKIQLSKGGPRHDSAQSWQRGPPPPPGAWGAPPLHYPPHAHHNLPPHPYPYPHAPPGWPHSEPPGWGHPWRPHGPPPPHSGGIEVESAPATKPPVDRFQ